ncbi:hypothetical protein ASPCAL14616 [Aspergillus calidoustus]|uniref:Uncharacterized protein n=1 Tax=Aspergillus calidoustus TaxID=454130 RepID=A0A0U5CK79_ASPCI|nr:hypothetical protein ASPCAL14616 [Aspergillus calidoustus]
MADWNNVTATNLISVEGGLSSTVTEITLSPPVASNIPATTWTIWPNGETVLAYTTYLPGGVPQAITSTFDREETITAGLASNDVTTTLLSEQTSTATRQTTGSGSGSTSSPSASSTQTPGIDPVNSSSDGFSTGTLAGAVVGSIVGSALLTLLLALLFFRRRPKELARNADDDVTYAGIVTDKSITGFSLAAIVPQPADDETVRRRVLTLIDHAGLHVDNYYTTASPALSQDAIAKLNQFDSGFLPTAAGTVLGERKSQRQVITHLLVYKLLQAIRPGGELLPPLLASQPQIENSSVSTDNALFTWRMLSAHLYREAKYSRDPTQMAALTKAARDLALGFTKAFTPYALPNFSEADRVTHFKDLAAATTELGIWLFAQPCTFDFVWNKSQTEITVIPRVLKTYDEQGNRLSTPQVLVEGDRAPILMTAFRHEMS